MLQRQWLRWHAPLARRLQWAQRFEKLSPSRLQSIEALDFGVGPVGLFGAMFVLWSAIWSCIG